MNSVERDNMLDDATHAAAAKLEEHGIVLSLDDLYRINDLLTGLVDDADLLTLDAALDRFRAKPGRDTAATLRAVATEYAAAEIINDDTRAGYFAETVVYVTDNTPSS